MNPYDLGVFYEPTAPYGVREHTRGQTKGRRACTWWKRLRCPGKGARCNSDSVCPGQSICCIHSCDVAYCTMPPSLHQGNYFSFSFFSQHNPQLLANSSCLVYFLCCYAPLKGYFKISDLHVQFIFALILK